MGVEILQAVAQLDPGVVFERSQDWLPSLAVFGVTLAATYLFGRFLVVPPAVRVVELRNRNNPTLANAIKLYLRVLFAAIGVPLAITAAGFGGYLSGSAIVVAAVTLAVGVAGQDVISNLVSGVFLVLDANFNVGDYIEWDDSGGTVVAIGLRTTRVRTPGSELLTVPNSALSTMAVRHPYDLSRYRVSETLTVGYDENLDRVADRLTEAALEGDRVLSNPEPVVHVTKLDDSAIRLVLRYWVAKPKETDILDVRSGVATRAKDRLVAEDIEIAPATGQDLSGRIEVAEAERARR